MPRSPSISICNEALDEVPAATIVSLDDDQPEARVCARRYDKVLQELLETHDWVFARERVALAPLAINNRSGEWLYAYAKPADMASSTTVIRPLQAPISGVYYPWPYNYPRPPYLFTDYLMAGNAIYSNVSGAILEYVSRDVEEERMPELFKRAVALELASRIVTPLLNSREKKGDLIQQAETAKRRAMAEDLNSYPRRDFAAFDEVAMVRS